MESLYNKVKNLQALPGRMRLYQKETPTRMLFGGYCEFLRAHILKNIFERLLLKQLTLFLNGDFKHSTLASSYFCIDSFINSGNLF